MHFFTFYKVIDAVLRASFENQMALETPKRKHGWEKTEEKQTEGPSSHGALAGHPPAPVSPRGNCLPFNCAHPMSRFQLQVGQKCVTFCLIT